MRVSENLYKVGVERCLSAVVGQGNSAQLLVLNTCTHLTFGGTLIDSLVELKPNGQMAWLVGSLEQNALCNFSVL